jgi:predicted HTH transcriptional regulator
VGGQLWVGITDDGLRVGVADARQVMADVRLASELCEPVPALNLRRHREEGLILVEARVKPTRPGPVEVTVDGARRVFVRDGSSTRPAEEEALQRMLRKDGPSRAHLDKKAVRVLNLLHTSGPLDQGEVARSASMSRQAARRILVELVQANLAQEVQNRRYSLTPSGHRKGKRPSRGDNA